VNGMQRFLKRVWTFTCIAVFLAIVGLLITREYQPPGAFEPAVERLIAGDQFDFFGWEARTLTAKVGQSVVPAQDYLSEAQRKSVVQAYVQLVGKIQDIQSEIDDIYADPKIPDPAPASAQQRTELAQLRAQQTTQQTLVETIIEEQISTVLNEQGFAVGGQVIPPVKFRLSPLPQMLIISPRDKIYQKDAFTLIAGLPTDRAEEIESEVDKRFNVSSLVEPIGGLGIYPAMMLEVPSTEWMVRAGTHEWTHNWLELRPLGMNYEKSPETRTMNETTAVVVEKEVGTAVLRRFYPELAPAGRPTPTPGPTPTPAPTPTPDPNQFDFRAEMHVTRVEVDRLLALAREAKQADDTPKANALIVQAEDTMRERRKVFAEHGYNIRKLNQAYFAFNGAYADEPGGAAGEDPVGPAVSRLRSHSPSLLAFLDSISQMTSYAELVRALGE
jgi:hypothetical protein